MSMCTNKEIGREALIWARTRFVCMVLTALLFVGCSRSGYHPEPIAPRQATSPYDVRPILLLMAKETDLDFGPGFVWPKQQPLRVADVPATSIFTEIENTGLNTLAPRSLFFEVTIDDQVAWRTGDHPDPIRPGKFSTRWREFSWSGIKLNKPGRYEVRLRAWLLERFGETNLDDNELILHVDVVEE